MITSTEKLAYIAGFFDGEGCISVHFASAEHKNTILRASITQNVPEPLEMIQELFGGSLCRTNKKAIQLSINGKKAHIFLETILPYLTVKREQALVAIQFAAATKEGRVEIRNELQRIRKAI